MSGEIANFLGRDAKETARRLADRGFTGVVVGVRLPPSNWPVSEQHGWTSVMVTIDGERREFYPTARREVWVVELDVGDHLVSASGSESAEILRHCQQRPKTDPLSAGES
jgi:hypothetical protein